MLSLAALRRLRFVTDLDGKLLAKRPEAEQAARVALAALGVAAIVHQRAQGYDLRSRCLLVPEGELGIDLVHGNGTRSSVTLDVDAANALLRQAHEQAGACGLGWEREPMKLKPAPKLVALVKKSRAEAAAGTQE